jgi:hypothetical protein
MAVSRLLIVFVLVGCGPHVNNNTGDGGNTSCDPGTTQQCYDGAGGTQGVGPCVAGSQQCQSDHTWGPCSGEVVP